MTSFSSMAFRPRPGDAPHISPEGIIYGTDGKCRWVYEAARSLGPFRSKARCTLFTMDESSVSSRQVKGRIHRDEVVHAFAVWVGGQSQPALRFDLPKQISLQAVRRITPEPVRHRIRLHGVRGSFFIQAEPQQFQAILDHLTRHCPQCCAST